MFLNLTLHFFIRYDVFVPELRKFSDRYPTHLACITVKKLSCILLNSDTSYPALDHRDALRTR